MKKWIALTVVATSIGIVLPAQARNVKYMLPIAAAMENGGSVDPSVKLYFGPQAAPRSTTTLASEVEGEGKTHIRDNPDVVSCNASFVEGLQRLQKAAIAIGANAVVNIGSYFRKGEVNRSATEFECHAGSHATVVFLKGDLAKLEGK